MYARAVEDAATRLRDLRREEWEDLGLAALALAFAVAATHVHPAFALPLFVGGLAVGARGVRALWRRWDLIERLAGERDAYVISEVLAHASRETTMERRRTFAALIRSSLSEPVEARGSAAAEELEALASELEDGELALDPASAVACTRLLSDVVGSPLLNLALTSEELRSRVRQIRSGFRPCRFPA
jgi:hypothetical protein